MYIVNSVLQDINKILTRYEQDIQNLYNTTASVGAFLSY